MTIASWIAGTGFLLSALGADPTPRATPLEERLTVMPRVFEDEKSAEQPPFPQEGAFRVVVPDEVPWFQPPTRINRYEVWQLYDVGRYGQFRPRVIYAPYGAFYLYDGRPYPWVSTHQSDFLPRVVGP